MKQHILSDAIYTYSELQTMLGVTKRTLSKDVESGKLRAVVYGNKYRFLGSEILRYLNKKMVQI